MKFTQQEIKNLRRLADSLKDEGPKITEVIETKPSQDYPGKKIALCKVDSYATPYIVAKDFTSKSSIPSLTEWFRNERDARKYYKDIK